METTVARVATESDRKMLFPADAEIVEAAVASGVLDEPIVPEAPAKSAVKLTTTAVKLGVVAVVACVMLEPKPAVREIAPAESVTLAPESSCMPPVAVTEKVVAPVPPEELPERLTETTFVVFVS